MLPRTKHSATSLSPWQWPQRYTMLQGPVMKDMIHVYKTRLPGPGQSHWGNTTHLCATLESVTEASGKYTENGYIALLPVIITFCVNF